MSKKSVPLESLIKQYQTNSDVRLGMALETLQDRLGQFFFEARVSQGLTVSDLAIELGLSPKTMEQLEAGKDLCNLSMTMLCRWAHRLGFTIILEVKPESLPTGRRELSVNLRVEL